MFIIILVIFLILIFMQFHKSKKDHNGVIHFFTGSIGSGKTLKGTHYTKFKYNLAKLLHKIHILKAEPRVYSTIPLYLGKHDDVYVLKREHLLLQEFFPSNVCPFTFVDELSMIASCYGWDDPNFTSRNLNENMNTLDTFVRFFRHFYGRNNNDRSRLTLTDQATGGVNIQIRRRLGQVNYLYNFRRLWKVFPFYKIDTKELIVEEDTVNTNNVDMSDKEKQYFIGHLPYRWLSKLLRKKSLYDSHCFSEVMITHKFVSKLDFDIWPKDKLTTNYCPDLRMSDAERKAYKKLLKDIQLPSLTTENVKVII